MSQTSLYARLALPALLVSGAMMLFQMLGDSAPPIQSVGGPDTCASLRCTSASAMR